MIIFLFFLIFSSIAQGTITHCNGEYFISTKHFLLGFGIDIYNLKDLQDSREIGIINAINYCEDGFFSDDFEYFKNLHKDDSKWFPKTIESFSFEYLRKEEWEILENYPLILDLLSCHQRMDILNSINKH